MTQRPKIKVFLLLITVILMATSINGCYDRTEIDDLGYVLAIGIDKGKTNAIRLTLQIAEPTGGGGGGDSGGGGGSDKGEAKGSLITVIECPTIYTGLNMSNSYISKELNMSHAKVIVFSEEMARQGLQKYVHTMIRGREFRPNMYVLVARGTAEDFIKSVKPKLTNPAKYYEQDLRSYTFSGLTANTQLINFYLQEESTSKQAVATLAGVARYDNPDQFSNTNSTFKQKGRVSPLEGDFLAGDVPKTGDIDSEIMGLAVFDGAKMVGELDGEEGTLYLLATNTYNHAYWSIPDPKSENDFVILDIKKSRNTVQKADYNGGNPKIDLKLTLEADILSIQSGINYENIDNGNLLEEAAADFIKKGMERFLNKTKEMKSDICGFGGQVKMKCLTWDEWMAKDWLKTYPKSTFTVEVTLKVRRPGLMIRSIPAIPGEAGEEAK